MSNNDLRITCLIPSATDICVLSLGLRDSIVGVTHECDHSLLPPTTRVVTADHLDSHNLSQADIHQRVQEQVAAAASAVCSRSDGIGADAASVPSLYPILQQEFLQANANLVITQDLCAVCAPTPKQVYETLGTARDGSQNNQENGDNNNHPRILSLTPETLLDIPENIQTVAAACGMPKEQGEAAAAEFRQHLNDIQSIVQSHVATATTNSAQITEASTSATTARAPSSGRRPRMLLLEWLDPPMDGGHWIPEMMKYAGLDCADLLSDTTKLHPRKSQAMTWSQIQNEIQPDVILVACCGFDLARNLQDALLVRHELAQCHGAKVVVTNGDLYFARPGPRLVVGTAIMALAAYADAYPAMAKAILELPFMQNLDPTSLLQTVDVPATDSTTPVTTATSAKSANEPIPDIEDAFALHARACEAKESFYKDPQTGYMVFTEYAHKLRGKCCGSGCRHCPYSHINVRDKANKIQQPAILYAGDDDDDTNHLLSLKHGNVRVLFFSGGKDSFLALRALAREAKASSPFGVCLLTTFDATSRVVAHQDISISVMERQARHLGVALVGVPMHRASSEGYVERIRKGLDVLESFIQAKVSAFVFGDLHLEHIVTWRKENLGSLGYDLQSPLLNVDYEDLAKDLERSGVPCIVSSSTIEGISVGDSYDKGMREKLAVAKVDLFGENGEFHTEAQVWKVDRSQALFD